MAPACVHVPARMTAHVHASVCIHCVCVRVCVHVHAHELGSIRQRMRLEASVQGTCPHLCGHGPHTTAAMPQYSATVGAPVGMILMPTVLP